MKLLETLLVQPDHYTMRGTQELSLMGGIADSLLTSHIYLLQRMWEQSFQSLSFFYLLQGMSAQSLKSMSFFFLY